MTIFITLLFGLAGAIAGKLSKPAIIAVTTMINGGLTWWATWWTMENFFFSSTVLLMIALCTSSAISLGLLEKRRKAR